MEEILDFIFKKILTNKYVYGIINLLNEREVIVMENKQEICNLLLKTLKATRYGSDIAEINYYDEGNYGEYGEKVIISYSNGYEITANVTADSGIAMIEDIIDTLLQS